MGTIEVASQPTQALSRAIIAEHFRTQDLQTKREQKAAEALVYSEIGGDPQDLEDDNK